MKKIKVGFVGLGHNGLAHIRAHRELGQSEVVALCDRNEERLRRAGEEFGVSRLYADDRFYSDPEVEAVSIHTGDNDHKDPFLKALRAQKHILIEKPLANSEADVREMVAAAASASASLRIQVGYILRFNPVFERIHELARSGRLGRIYYMEGDYIHNLLDQARPERTDPVTHENWYLRHEIPVVGGGSHPLDILRWVSGKEIVRVFGCSNHVAFPEMRHDDCQVCMFQFEDGTLAKVASLYAPRCGMAPFYNIRVYGTCGTVERDTVALAESADDVHPAFRPIEAERPEGHPYRPEINDWLDAIREGRPPRTPLFDAANSTMAALCAARAIREGKQVEIPVFSR
jgi:predicted dehydrogenase